MATIGASVTRVTAHRDADGLRVLVVGELDLTAWKAVTAILPRLDGVAGRLLVDLSGVTFIDLKGLDALGALCDAATACGLGVDLWTSGLDGLARDLVEAALVGADRFHV
jgi:anti-anti-sigma regulatory factor